MQQFSALYRLMSRATRWRLLTTSLLMLLAIGAEIVTVGAVFPLLALGSGQGGGLIDPRIGEWLAWIGGTPLVGAAILLAVAAVAAAAIRLLLAWATQRFVSRLGHELAMAIFSRMLRQPYADYLQQNSSEALSAMERPSA